MAKASRSQFIEKLHSLLEHPHDADSLRWISPQAFEITCDDRRARNALSPSWEFRSLSSFIRQLSYYNFKRLSDRRRSSERRAVASGFIIFSHPSGFFTQGDATQLHGIVRKTRNRPEKTGIRRASATSMQSSLDDDHEPPPPPPPPMTQPMWPVDNRHLAYPDDRRQSYTAPHLSHATQSFQPPFPSVRQMVVPDAPYRSYVSQSHPSTWDDLDRPPQHHRRPSDFGGPPLSPRSQRVDLSDPSRPQPPGPRKLSIYSQHKEQDYRSPYPTPTLPTFAENRSGPDSVPSGLAIPYDESSPRPTFAPVPGYHSSFGSSNQPLPSPTGSSFSSGSDAHGSEHNHLPPFNPGPPVHGNGSHLDPRSLANSRLPHAQPSSYFSSSSPAWAPPNAHRGSTGDAFQGFQPPAILSPRR